MREQFEVRLMEDNNPNRAYIEVYNGLLDSPLFDGCETLLLICIMMGSTAQIDSINTATISINKLCRYSKMSKKTVCRYIKKLEEKGVLIKQRNSTPDNGNTANTYKILNYISVWDCKTMEELKRETDKIKSEVLING